MLSSTAPYGGMSVIEVGDKYHLTIKQAAEEFDIIGLRIGIENLDCIVDSKLYNILGHDVHKSICYLKEGSIDYREEIVDIVLVYRDYKSAENMFMEIKLKL